MDWTSPALWALLLAGPGGRTPADLALRPERWPTRASVASTDALLRAPLEAPRAVDALASRLDAARGAGGLLREAFAAAGVEPAPPTRPGAAPLEVPGLPPAAAAPVARLLARLDAASADARAAAGSLTPAERAAALRAARATASDADDAAPDDAGLDAAVRFDRARAAAAGLAAAGAVDDAVDELSRLPPLPAFDARFDAPVGRVIVSSGEVRYSASDAGAALIVHLGGPARYAGAVASADAGEVRVVVDLGGPVVVESSGPAAASARFGVAGLALVGPGEKTVTAGPESLGAAFFGAAFAAIRGGPSRLRSGAFGQGAAVFGAAVLDTGGDGSALAIDRAGQGFGGPGGGGAWRHRGNGLDASCGFARADPREPLGSVSEGQGAGMGPRAFAAGGVGAALVVGDRARLKASYFAQGSGYWRGLGLLAVRGDDAELLARRYAQGAGVHSAVGALSVDGARARIDSWGGSFALGWDEALGLARVRGDGAAIRSDWTDGRGESGGRALAWIEGDGDRLSLEGFASANDRRAVPGAGLAVLRGRGARVRAPWLDAPAALSSGTVLRRDPWSAWRLENGASLEPALALPDPLWPAAPLASSATAAAPAPIPPSGRARVARLLADASADILDPRPALGAARELMLLPERDAPALAAALDPERYDELIWARDAAASLGPAAARAAVAAAKRAPPLRRAALLDWLRFGRARESLDAAEGAAADSDWRIRRAAAGVVGDLFGTARGEEPGRLSLVRAAADGTLAPGLDIRRLSELHATLALSGPLDDAARASLYEKSGTPFDSVSPEAVKALAALLAASPPRRAALAREAADADRLAPRARRLLRALADDRDDWVAAAALQSLGSAGNADDASHLGATLASGATALRRDAAGEGLARLGPGASATLKSLLSSTDPAVRARAAVAAARSWDAGVSALAGGALADADASVRVAAASALGSVDTACLPAAKSNLEALRKSALGDPDESVRAAAALALARLK